MRVVCVCVCECVCMCVCVCVRACESVHARVPEFLYINVMLVGAHNCAFRHDYTLTHMLV